MQDRTGQRLGQYRLMKLLGIGGFAEVYLGEHIFLKTRAAIKILHVQLAKEERDNFLKEAQTLVNLEHPHIIKVIDCDVDHDTPFIVMHYAPNGNLRQRYQKRMPAPLARILPDVQQIAEALQYAHEKKLIHRDVKPENVLVGAQQEILLSDFGLAVVAQSTRHQKRQTAFGTLPYMAPEQLHGHPCFASDQYSLGIVVYEWLCGGLPFTGSAMELIFQHENVSPPSMYQQVQSISLAVEQVVRQALMKDPRKRFASIREFAQALEEANRPERSSTVSKRSVSAPTSVERLARFVVATPPQKAATIWNVPFRRNIFFTGREYILFTIHETLHPSRAYDTIRPNKVTTLTHTLAISGLGGIGKTQTVVEYVYRYYDDYQAVLWIRADTRETFTTDVLNIATRLNLGGASAQDMQHTIEAVKDWLHRHDRWLLVVDNVEDFTFLKAFLPSTVQGHILLTTCTQNTSTLAQRIDLPIMRDDEGALFLLRRIGILALDASLEDGSESDYTTAKAIVALLGGLPLALDQAGAYIGETGCSLEDYLHRYATSRATLLSMRGALVTDHQESVTETILSALKKIESASSSAIELLGFCAFLAPHAIPEEILTEGAMELGPTLQAVATNPVELDRGIAALRKFSLVRRSPDAKMLSLHPLVQATVEDSMSEDLRCTWAARVMRAVNHVFPDVYELTTWSRCKQYSPHALHCVGLIEQWQMQSPEAIRLLEQTSMYVREHADYAQADTLFRRAGEMRRKLAAQEQQAASPMPISMTDLNTSVWQRYHRGMYAQAEPFVKNTLAFLEQQGEVDTPLVAYGLFGLAKISYEQGHYERAEALFLQALAMCEQMYGLRHPSFACNLDGLGQLYLLRGQYNLAESMLQQALGIWEQQAEPRHPWMSSSLLHLAQCALAQADYAKAECYLKREQAFLEQAFGLIHPAIAYSLNDWAHFFMACGRYKQAEAALQRAITILEQIEGLKHLIAGRTLNTQARLYYLQGKYTQAERLLQRALAIYETHLGVDHADVATVMHNLAEIYTAQNNRTLAKELYQSALDVRRKALGPEHINVAESLNCLARLYYGDYSCAEAFYKEALAIREKVLGPQHPHVAQSLNDLANLYRNLARITGDRQRYVQAEPLYKRALAIREQVLGPEHRDVAEVLINYASLLSALDRKVESTELHMRAKVIFMRWREQEET
jgi:serine/threonine protein kinase/tetratricopeptide (TPR) repeat protein